jgi:hypothetical protein
MRPLFVQYGYLQVLDLLTAVAFLKGGWDEAQPLIARLVNAAPSPVAILIAIKVCAVILGIYCWRLERRAALVKAIVFYAVLVAWNLLCLINSVGVTAMRVGVHAR